MAGAAAVTAAAVTLTPIQVIPADVAVPAQPTSTQPHLTKAMIDLLAAARNVPVPTPPHLPAAGVVPKVGTAPLAAAPPVVGPQNAASDWLTGAYQGTQAWVDWGVNYGVQIAYWLAGWGVPFAYTVGAQTNIVYWTLIRPVSNDIFYQAVVPIVNDPLNLNVWVNGISNAIRYAANDVVNFGIAEFNYFFGWILPPLPPRPPGPLAALPASLDAAAQAVQAVQATLTNFVAAVDPAKTPAKVEPTADPKADPKTTDSTAKVVPTAAETPAGTPAQTPEKVDTNAKTDDKTAGQPTADAHAGDTTTTTTTTDPKTDTKTETKTDPTSGTPAADTTTGPAKQQDDPKTPQQPKVPGKKTDDKTVVKNTGDSQPASTAGTQQGTGDKVGAGDTTKGNTAKGNKTKGDKVKNEKTKGDKGTGPGRTTGAGQSGGSDNHAGSDSHAGSGKKTGNSSGN
ncbi:hypothetical protein B5P44_19615 [Mycobacterium sp. CBMA 213]|nr:hypothetical protein [Mycolicibacterium sp. CBMA 213]